MVDWSQILAAVDRSPVLAAVLSGVVLGLLGFGARALLKWSHTRKGQETWSYETRDMLIRLYKHRDDIRLRKRKERFAPPYIADGAWVGDERRQSNDLEHLVPIGLVKSTQLKTESTLDGGVMIDEKYVLTPLGVELGKRFLKQEERALSKLPR